MKPVTIVGGGLAGLSLGIILRNQGVPTTVVEAGEYPRHRVCGEFISGAGQAVLGRLGVVGRLREAGLREVDSVLFGAGAARSRVDRLPEPGWAISRHILDAVLASEFQRLEGILRIHDRWKEGFAGEGIVRATGRRVSATDGGRRLLGVKAHFWGVKLRAGLEMHFRDGAYVGLCQLPGDEVNACGLFWSESTRPGLAAEWRELLAGPPEGELRNRLGEAGHDAASVCMVAGLSLGGMGRGEEECAVGDSITMIPPVTGNGMSMAFESAELAGPVLERYARGGLAWGAVREEVRRLAGRRFGRRLAWAARAQHVLMRPGSARWVPALLRFGAGWRFIFGRTR